MGKKIRESVDKFAELMENRLRENDHKGGWSNENTDWLFKRLLDESDELKKAMDEYDVYQMAYTPRPGELQDRRRNVRKECADVANFAMMIADLF